MCRVCGSKPKADRYDLFNDSDAESDHMTDIRLDMETLLGGHGKYPPSMAENRNRQPGTPRDAAPNAMDAQSTTILTLNQVNLDLFNANSIQLHTIRRAHSNEPNVDAEWEKRNPPSRFHVTSEGVLTAAHQLAGTLGTDVPPLDPISSNDFTTEQTTTSFESPATSSDECRRPSAEPLERQLQHERSERQVQVGALTSEENESEVESEEDYSDAVECQEFPDHIRPVASTGFASRVLSGAISEEAIAENSVQSFDDSLHTCNSSSCLTSSGSEPQTVWYSAIEIDQPSPSASSVPQLHSPSAEDTRSSPLEENPIDPSTNVEENSSQGYFANLRGNLSHATEATWGYSWIEVLAAQNRRFRSLLKLDPIKEAECEADDTSTVESTDRAALVREEVTSAANAVTATPALNSAEFPFVNMMLASASIANTSINTGETHTQYTSDAEDADEEDNVEFWSDSLEEICLQDNTEERDQASSPEMTQSESAYGEDSISDADEEGYVFVEREPDTDASWLSLRNWNRKSKRDGNSSFVESGDESQ